MRRGPLPVPRLSVVVVRTVWRASQIGRPRARLRKDSWCAACVASLGDTGYTRMEILIATSSSVCEPAPKNPCGLRELRDHARAAIETDGKVWRCVVWKEPGQQRYATANFGPVLFHQHFLRTSYYAAAAAEDLCSTMRCAVTCAGKIISSRETSHALYCWARKDSANQKGKQGMQ